jgi:NADH/NAD ratio-sensing transcriptional regulator Rex
MFNLLSHDVVVRAIKTFVQAFLATIAVGVVGVTDIKTAQALAVAGVSAGISAVWNFILATK